MQSTATKSFLATPIEYLKGVGPERADILKKELEIFTFGDLLKLYPYRYIDRTQFYSTQHIDNTQTFIQLKGKLKDIRELGEGRARRLTAVFYDADGEIELVWFQGVKWLVKSLNTKETYVLYGKPSWFNHEISKTCHQSMPCVMPAISSYGRRASLRAIGNNTSGAYIVGYWVS